MVPVSKMTALVSAEGMPCSTNVESVTDQVRFMIADVRTSREIVIVTAINWTNVACGGDGTSCLGCTDDSACNFDNNATIDDGSCLFLDCNGVCGGTSVEDDCGVCDGPGPVFQCGCENIPAGQCDCNGNVVDVLGVCGGSCMNDSNNNGVCDDAEVLGCTYSDATNFDAEATDDDGSCEFPAQAQSTPISSIGMAITMCPSPIS